MTNFRVFVTILVALCAVVTNGFELGLTEGGYTGLVVAIHRNIPEDKRLIDNIKEMFTKGSSYLHKVTGQRLYFKTVTIAIPETWKGEYNQTLVFTDYFSKSHVRIAQANSEFGDAPYTLQPGECGEQGEYIHLTPKFITELDGWTQEMYGDVGPQIVHEFSHFRFGVFDEYGTQGSRRFPLFYNDNGKILPSSCIKDVKGWIEQENGDRCVVYEGGVVGDECRFIPDLAPDSQTMEASLMYMPFMPSMPGYCEDGNVAATKKHNWRAPTKQNAFCNYKSTWEIIKMHKDIKTSVSRPSANTKPTFNIVRFGGNEARKLVLVMDISSSMNSYDRIGKLKRAASRFVKDILPWNVSVAIVEFSIGAQATVGLTKVVNSATREMLINKIPQRAPGGGTSVGSGLQKALEVLRQNNGKTEGATIVVITDGEENRDPKIDRVLPSIVAAKVMVNTIAIGGSAAAKLETVATRTGGQSFYFPDTSQEVASLDTAFQSSISSQVDVELQPLTILSETITLKPNENLSRIAAIDGGLGKNTVFTFRGSNLAKVEISLKSPSGKTYSKSSPEFEEDLNVMKRKKFLISQAENGKWQIILKSASAVTESLSFTLSSEVNDPKDQPIRASSWFDKPELSYPAYVKVLARVTKGYDVVLYATVKATIVRPDGSSVEIPLRDNGAGADAIKDDGIYSSYFKAFTANGRYAAVASVINDGKAVIKKSAANYGQNSGAPSKPKAKKAVGTAQSEFEMEEFRQIDEPIPEPRFQAEPTDDFSRNVDLGNFQLANFVKDTRDVTPPNRVTDLSIESISEKVDEDTPRNVTLVWTAAGDDLDEGTAKSVEIRGTEDGEKLFTNFEANPNLWHITTTVKAGNLQRETFDLPNEWTRERPEGFDFFIALKTVDKAGNKSPVSNIVTGHIGYTAPPLIITTTAEPIEEETTKPTTPFEDTTVTAETIIITWDDISSISTQVDENNTMSTIFDNTTAATIEPSDFRRGYNSGLSTWLIVTIVIGVLIAVGVIVSIVVYVKKSSKNMTVV